MARDNFRPHTKELLGQAAGFNCVRPGCARPTTAYDPDEGVIRSLKSVSHDAAASAGGPRYDSSMTSEQRKAYENGAWLCPICARLVDVDHERFPIGTITTWQSKAAEYRRNRMHMPNQPAGLDFKNACEAAQRFLTLCNNITFDDWSRYFPEHSIYAMEELARLSFPLIATNQYCAQFPHMVNLQTQMLEATKFIRKEVSDRGCWWHDYNSRAYIMIKMGYCYSDAEKVQKNRIDTSYNLVINRMGDFLNLKSELSNIAYSPYPIMDLFLW